MDLGTLRNEVHECFNDIARKVLRATWIIKGGFALGGGVIAGVAALFLDGPTQPFSTALWIALFGAFLSLVAGVVTLAIETDAARSAETARRALDRAGAESDRTRRALELAAAYEKAVKGLVSTNLVYHVARNLLEQSAALRKTDAIDTIVELIDLTKRDLQLALGFETDHTWTICVYRAERNDFKLPVMLRCVAHARSIECKIDKARLWKEGVGVGGVAFAKRAEVVAPDIAHSSAGSAFSLNGDNFRKEDAVRYRSVVAVPVLIGAADAEPWGVVMATSDQPEHFGRQNMSGLPTEEPVRTLASIVALIVAISRMQQDASSTMSEKDA